MDGAGPGQVVGVRRAAGHHVEERNGAAEEHQDGSNAERRGQMSAAQHGGVRPFMCPHTLGLPEEGGEQGVCHQQVAIRKSKNSHFLHVGFRMAKASSSSAKPSNPLQPVENNVVTDVREHESKHLCVQVKWIQKKVATKYMCVYLEALGLIRWARCLTDADLDLTAMTTL